MQKKQVYINTVLEPVSQHPHKSTLCLIQQFWWLQTELLKSTLCLSQQYCLLPGGALTKILYGRMGIKTCNKFFEV